MVCYAFTDEKDPIKNGELSTFSMDGLVVFTSKDSWGVTAYDQATIGKGLKKTNELELPTEENRIFKIYGVGPEYIDEESDRVYFSYPVDIEELSWSEFFGPRYKTIFEIFENCANINMQLSQMERLVENYQSIEKNFGSGKIYMKLWTPNQARGTELEEYFEKTNKLFNETVPSVAWRRYPVLMYNEFWAAISATFAGVIFADILPQKMLLKYLTPWEETFGKLEF